MVKCACITFSKQLLLLFLSIQSFWVLLMRTSFKKCNIFDVWACSDKYRNTWYKNEVFVSWVTSNTQNRIPNRFSQTNEIMLFLINYSQKNEKEHSTKTSPQTACIPLGNYVVYIKLPGLTSRNTDKNRNILSVNLS